MRFALCVNGSLPGTHVFPLCSLPIFKCQLFPYNQISPLETVDRIRASDGRREADLVTVNIDEAKSAVFIQTL